MILGPLVPAYFYELPIYQFVEFLDEPMPDEVISCQFMACQVLNEQMKYPIYMGTRHLVQRRNPHDLAQLARATIFDNLNKCNGSSETNCCEKVYQLETDDCYLKRCCCDRIWKLIMKIDQLEIPASEKLMMKKLIPGALRLQKILNDRHYLSFVKYLNVVGGT